MSWDVSVIKADWRFMSQNASPTQDNQIDENATYNCGETCVAMVGWYYSKGERYVAPDTIKDWLLGQGVAGSSYVSYNTSIMSALSHFFGIPSVTKIPMGCHNYSNGLLDYSWQALRNNIPAIESFYWVDDAGEVHTNINHWRVIVEQTDTDLICADPWPSTLPAMRRIESWDVACARSRQVMVVPTIRPNFVS